MVKKKKRIIRKVKITMRESLKRLGLRNKKAFNTIV